MSAPPDPANVDPANVDNVDPANPRPSPPPRPIPPRQPPRPKRDYAAEEEAGRRLTNVHLQLRRGQVSEAEASVRAILAERPADAGASELLGDVLSAREDWDAAAASYQAALKAEPGRASAEAKFGKTALRRAEQQSREKMGVAYASEDTALVRREGGARGGWPVILGSLLCPGLGQIVQGQTLKGGILLGVFLLCLGLLALLPHGGSGRSYFGPAFWLVSALLVADSLYAVADAALASRGKS